jgi:hypothetical protein
VTPAPIDREAQIAELVRERDDLREALAMMLHPDSPVAMRPNGRTKRERSRYARVIRRAHEVLGWPPR